MKTSHVRLLELHVAVFLFGVTGVFGKFLAIPALTIVFGRAAFAALALLGYLFFFQRRELALKPGNLPMLFLCGAVLAVHWTTFFHSVQISSVAVALLTYSSFPLFVTFLEPVFFKERLRAIDVATAVLVLIGLVLIVPSFDFGNDTTRGVFWGTLSGATFAVLSLLNRKLVGVYSPVVLSGLQNATAALVLLPLVSLSVLTANDIGLLAVMGVVCTALSHTLFIKSLQYVRAQTAAVAGGLEAVYGIFFAIVLLGEAPAVRTLCGGALILFAVTLSTFARADSTASVEAHAPPAG